MIDVLWEGEAPRDEALVRRVEAAAAAALEGSARDLAVLLTDDPTIAALNAQWRGVEGPTDVLSFPQGDPEPGLPDEAAPLGDVVISVQTAQRQADGRDRTLAEEVVFLLVHGLCHLHGHDHGEPQEAALMRAAEERLLALAAPGQSRPQDLPY